MNAHKIISYITDLGFGKDEAELYLVLSQRGAMSILEAARATGIERTKLYRMVDSLLERGLIEEQLTFKSTYVRAVSADKILAMVEQKRDNFEILKSEHAAFKKEIETISMEYTPTNVLYFRGVEGIKQMQWNTLGAKKEMVSYVARAFQESVGQKYLEAYARAWRELKIDYLELKSEFFESTIDPLKKLFPVDLGGKYRFKIAPKEVVEITQNVDIYNDVVAMYYWKEGEVFGVEIHNKEMATMQKSLFRTAWKKIS